MNVVAQFALLTLLGTVSLSAVEIAYSRQCLVDNPPLGVVPKTGSDKSTKETKAAVELRGFFGRGESLHVSLWRMDTRDAVWVRVGTKEGRFQIESADPESGSAVVFVDGV